MNAAHTVLITGANAPGVGYETVKALLESSKPYHIILGCRSLEKARSSMETLRTECSDTKSTMEELELDVTSDASIERAFEHIKTKHGYIDTLLNNAGATFDLEWLQGKRSLRDTFNEAYNVNVTGAHVMTYTFMPILLKSKDPRIMFVAGLSQLTAAAEKYFPTPQLPAGWPKEQQFETIGYRCSKTALSILMLDWNHKLKNDGVKVWSISPGMVATNLGGLGPEAARKIFGDAMKEPSTSGIFFRSVIEGERDADVGKIIKADGFVPW